MVDMAELRERAEEAGRDAAYGADSALTAANLAMVAYQAELDKHAVRVPREPTEQDVERVARGICCPNGCKQTRLGRYQCRAGQWDKIIDARAAITAMLAAHEGEG